jgi:argininosuccinate lyase
MALKGRLPGGYHRDFQLLKAPLFRGVDRTREMLGMLATAIPQLGVDAERAREALAPEVFATDEAMRRVREGVPFRRAYREVAAAVKQGEPVPVLGPAEIEAARTCSGGMGNVGLPALRARMRDLTRWNMREWKRHDGAMAKLVGTRRAR